MMSRTWLPLVILSACGTNVTGTAHIARGASKQSSPRTIGTAAATNGHWFLSPNAGTVTITSLRFNGPDGSESVDLSDCTPTYQRDSAELSSILDCPFEIGTGTYTTMSISVAAAAQVLIDDPTSGLFTDPSAPSGLVTTAPAGGAKPVTITVASGGDQGNEIQTAFAEPLVVTDGEPVTITILEDMIHTVFANVTGGSATFDVSLPLPPVSLLGTAGTVSSGSVEYYSPVGTADSWTNGMFNTGNETGSARVFFANGKPLFVWHVTLGNSEAWAADPAAGSGSRAGGYLGLDANGTLCWAQTSSDDLNWSPNGYSRVCRLQRAASVGATSSIECQTTSTAPAPMSGATYASGCPQIMADEILPVTLVAK